MKTNYLCPITLLAVISTMGVSTASAQGTSLIAKPDKCVSLRRGQLCYQRINLNWSADINGRYCIMASDRPTPLKCWSNSTRGKIIYSLESTENIDFQLISTPEKADESTNNSHADAVLSTATVTIAWVYNTKSRNRTTWRLF